MSFQQSISNLIIRLQPIGLSDKLFFVQYLRILLRSGFSLGEALRILALQTGNRRFRIILQTVQKMVEGGQSFGACLAKYESVFSAFIVNMVSAGEVSGNLEKTLEYLWLQMKKEHELKSRVRGALMYPAVVVAAMILVGIGMFIFVLPKITALFKEMNIALPLPTRIVIFISDLVTTRGPLLAIGFVIVVLLLWRALKTNKGQFQWHQLLLKIPIVAPIVLKINLALFSRTLSSLLHTDIPVVQSFQITGSVISNVLYRQAIASVAEELKRGIAIESSLRAFPQLFPPLVTQMVAVGEKSGTLDELLGQLAEFYEDEVDQTMRNLASIIEPVLIVLLGIAVGGLAVAIIMPMYALTEAM